MRILLLCDDEYHPAEIPVKGMAAFSPDVISDIGGGLPKLEDYDVVVLSKCDHVSREDKTPWKTPAVQDAFVSYVEAGGGLVVTHSGTIKGAGTARLDNLVGCVFTSHPNNCPVTVAPLKPHPVTGGVGIFTEVDEHYHIEILDGGIDVLAAGYAPAQGDAAKYETEPYFNAPEHIAPAVFTRTQGKGRVCVITPGHTLEVWLNPNFQILLKNALHWVGGS